MQEVRPHRKSLEATAKTTALRKPSLTTPSTVYIADLEHHTTFLQNEVLRAKSRIATLGSLLVASLVLNLVLLFFPGLSFSGGSFMPHRTVNQHTVDAVLDGDQPLGDLAPHRWGPKTHFSSGGEYNPYQNLTLKQLSWIFNDPWTRLGLNESNPTHPYSIFGRPLFGFFKDQAHARKEFWDRFPWASAFGRGALGPVDEESLDDYINEKLLVPWTDDELCRGEARLFREGVCEQAVREFERAGEEVRDLREAGKWIGNRPRWYRGSLAGESERKIRDVYEDVKEEARGAEETVKAKFYTAVEKGGSFVAEKLPEEFTEAGPEGSTYKAKKKNWIKKATEGLKKKFNG